MRTSNALATRMYIVRRAHPFLTTEASWLLSKWSYCCQYGHHFKLVPDSPKYLYIIYKRVPVFFWLVYHSCTTPYSLVVFYGSHIYDQFIWCYHSHRDFAKTLLLLNIGKSKASTFTKVTIVVYLMDVTVCWFPVLFKIDF